MKKIEPFQIRKIYAIGNALGIRRSGDGEDELHVLVTGVTGKSSIRELSYREAAAVIARLEGLSGAPAPERPKPKGTVREAESRPDGVTSGQQKKIWALMYSLKAYDEQENDVPLGDRLCAILKKEFGIDALARDPFAWLTFVQGNHLIEKLKGYVSSAARKGKGRADGAGI